MNLFKKIANLFWFIMLYLFRLIKSNINVAYDILTPKFRMTPGIIKIPVEVDTNPQLLALVNLVTMTPGTLTLDLSTDKKYIYIHAMYMKDREAFHKDIKNLERMIKKVF